jgi:hypothetical protein
MREVERCRTHLGSGLERRKDRCCLWRCSRPEPAIPSKRRGFARRLQWQYPEGANVVVAEYWLETEAPRVVAVVEADGMDPFGQIRMDWGDIFEIEVFPSVTAEQGLEMARQAMSGQG